MNFEEWWNISGGGVIHKDPKDAARDAWQSAYMQASSEMRDYIIDDVDYAEQDAVLEVDGVNLYFQFEREATLKEAVKYLKKELVNALAWDEEDVEHRVNAAWQTGYDAGRGVE